MADLFNRKVKISVAPRGSAGTLGAIENSMGFDLSDIDCTFRVKKSLKPEPNTCTLQIFNLAEGTRRVLESASKLGLRLEVGYESGTLVLFEGEIRSAHSFRDHADIITEISTGDSEEEMRTARISFTVGPQQPTDTALRSIVTAMGVGAGNVGQVAAKIKAKGKAIFGPGTVFHGNARVALDQICKSCGLEWSTQDGNMQLLELGRGLDAVSVELTPETGLVDFPTVDHKGVLSAKAFIQPDLVPGRLVTISSVGARGTFRLIDCEYIGDTQGNDWHVQMHGKLPGTGLGKAKKK